MKKFLSILLAAVMLVSLCAVSSAETTKETVTLWHLWTGAEEGYVNDVVEAFNASQDKYVVEALSVADEQKTLVAIASGEGPDVTDSFSSAVASYAAQGIMTNLDELIARDNYDLDQFVKVAVDSCRYEGSVYALPVSINLSMLFYNKDLFTAAGLEAPKTDVELLEDAIKLTEVNEDGSLKVLGFPDFPWVYYLSNFAYAFGASYTNDECTEQTIDTEGFRRALELMVEYRAKFGTENVTRFQSGGAYLDGTDPFVNGTQAMRVDGPWMASTLDNLGVSVNYGVVPIPYMDGHEDQAGRAISSSSMFYIPATAKNVDGAWEFLKFMCGAEGSFIFNSQSGGLPSCIEVLNNEEMQSKKDFKEFAALAQSDNLVLLPVFSGFNDYSKLINDEAELVVNGKETIDQAIENIISFSADMFE